MGQYEIKRSFSLGTKLLLIVVLLIMLVTAFLNTSAMFILREDKQAQTYQSKSTEAMLAGNQFATMLGHVLDTLRLTFATADPRKPAADRSATQSALQSVLDNQSEAAMLLTFLINPATSAIQPVSSAIQHRENPAHPSATTLKESDLILQPDWFKGVSGELNARSYAFINLSMTGQPLLGVVVANMKALDSKGNAGVALAVVPLSGMTQEFAGMSLTIATRSGQVLFDSDPTILYARSSITQDPLFQFAVDGKAENGTHDFYDNGERHLGSYVFPGYDLVALTRADWRVAMRATYAITEKFILLGLMSLGAGIVFAILFAKTLTAPLQRLSRATSEVASGNFKLSLEPAGNDEIGSLTESFNSMSARIEELFKESIEKIQLENELNIASTVQQNLIPPDHFQHPEVEVHSHYQSASHCGGDWWGFFRTRNHVVIGIADATGHGLQCALITAAARSAFSVLHKMAEEDPKFDFSPSRMMTYINRSIHDSAGGRIMMTFFVGVIDLATQTLTYANAGHNPPWLFRKEPNEDNKWVLKSLVGLGERLGEGAVLATIEEKSIPVAKEDVLFLYTDGLTECVGTEGEMYGKKRVRKLLEENLSQGNAVALERLLEDLGQYHRNVPLRDDVTIALARIVDFAPA